MKTNLLSALREGLRTMLIAAIPLVIIEIQAGKLDFESIYLAFVIGCLRGLEKFLYKNQITTGLTFRMIK